MVVVVMAAVSQMYIIAVLNSLYNIMLMFKESRWIMFFHIFFADALVFSFLERKILRIEFLSRWSEIPPPHVIVENYKVLSGVGQPRWLKK